MIYQKTETPGEPADKRSFFPRQNTGSDQINLSLSSGDEVDLNCLPVRVATAQVDRVSGTTPQQPASTTPGYEPDRLQLESTEPYASTANEPQRPIKQAPSESVPFWDDDITLAQSGHTSSKPNMLKERRSTKKTKAAAKQQYFEQGSITPSKSGIIKTMKAVDMQESMHSQPLRHKAVEAYSQRKQSDLAKVVANSLSAMNKGNGAKKSASSLSARNSELIQMTASLYQKPPHRPARKFKVNLSQDLSGSEGDIDEVASVAEDTEYFLIRNCDSPLERPVQSHRVHDQLDLTFKELQAQKQITGESDVESRMQERAKRKIVCGSIGSQSDQAHDLATYNYSSSAKNASSGKMPRKRIQMGKLPTQKKQDKHSATKGQKQDVPTKLATRHTEPKGKLSLHKKSLSKGDKLKPVSSPQSIQQLLTSKGGANLHRARNTTVLEMSRRSNQSSQAGGALGSMASKTSSQIQITHENFHSVYKLLGQALPKTQSGSKPVVTHKTTSIMMSQVPSELMSTAKLDSTSRAKQLATKTFEYAAAPKAVQTDRPTLDPDISGKKSGEVSDLSPDIATSLIQRNAESKSRLTSNWKIEPFAINGASEQLPIPTKTLSKGHLLATTGDKKDRMRRSEIDVPTKQYLSPRFNVTKYGSSHFKFKEQLSQGSHDKSSHLNGLSRQTGSKNVATNQDNKDVSSSRQGSNMARPSHQEGSNPRVSQNVSSPSEQSDEATNALISEPQIQMLRHSRHVSISSESNGVEATIAPPQDRSAPQDSTLRASVTKRQRQGGDAQSKATASSPPQDIEDTFRDAKVPASIAGTRNVSVVSITVADASDLETHLTVSQTLAEAKQRQLKAKQTPHPAHQQKSKKKKVPEVASENKKAKQKRIESPKSLLNRFTTKPKRPMNASGTSVLSEASPFLRNEKSRKLQCMDSLGQSAESLGNHTDLITSLQANSNLPEKHLKSRSSLIVVPSTPLSNVNQLGRSGKQSNIERQKSEEQFLSSVAQDELIDQLMEHSEIYGLPQRPSEVKREALPAAVHSKAPKLDSRFKKKSESQALRESPMIKIAALDNLLDQAPPSLRGLKPKNVNSEHKPILDYTAKPTPPEESKQTKSKQPLRNIPSRLNSVKRPATSGLSMLAQQLNSGKPQVKKTAILDLHTAKASPASTSVVAAVTRNSSRSVIGGTRFNLKSLLTRPDRQSSSVLRSVLSRKMSQEAPRYSYATQTRLESHDSELALDQKPCETELAVTSQIFSSKHETSNVIRPSITNQGGDDEYDLIYAPQKNEFNTQQQQPQTVVSTAQHSTAAATSVDYATAQQVHHRHSVKAFRSGSGVVSQSDQQFVSMSQSEVIPQQPESLQPAKKPELPKDEFSIFDDKAIHGWLSKRGKGYFASTWKRVFVIVDNQKLCYYGDQQLSTQKGVLDFSRIKARLLVVNERTFEIAVAVQGQPKEKTFTFQTQSAGSIATWITILNMQMANAEVQAASEAQLYAPLPEKAPVNFWKVCRISSEELLESAQTGDILLFTGKGVQDGILRGLTGSKYDHVGMLVRYPLSGQVILFESLLNKGVSRWDWLEYQNNNYWRQNYSKIVYRRLLGVERDEAFRATVTDFMVETVGKPYRMLGNLLGVQDQDDHTKAKIAAKAGFFCSELVASCLKRLSLLDPSVPSTQYWPGQFSTENTRTSVQLLQDAFYSEEITLDLQV